ncbi:MAG TPA: polysaccharide deacetylase family protein [Terracidiphilus sp.]|nr:polysaccharide deacetylase family protein [Terracidiphilus sp.]
MLRDMAMKITADMFWRMPASFGMARMLGQSSLRCVVFHNIAAAPSPFTGGIRVDIDPQSFEASLKFLTAHYSPVRLEDVLSDHDGRGLPPRAMLVTFDDAYASVIEPAAPLCRKYGIPAVFFVNAAFVDNRRLSPDNLICYVANVHGMGKINAAARIVQGSEKRELHSLAEVFGVFLPAISLADRDIFLDALRELAGIDDVELAREANLYATSEQLRSLKKFDFEIGNHTYTHTYCRLFAPQDFALEVDRNKEELESLSGAKVRSFSQPYGSSKDVTPELILHLKRSGHEAVFLSESVANPQRPNLFHLDRVSTCAAADDTLFFEIEVLPRLRAIRNRLFPKPSAARAA